MAIQLQSGLVLLDAGQIALDPNCCCCGGCPQCNDGTGLVCPKTLRVQLTVGACTYDFNVNCFQVISGVFPTATIQYDFISTGTEQKYVRLTVFTAIQFGSLYIIVGHLQYWNKPGFGVMQETTNFEFKTTVSGGAANDCLYPQWTHFPCTIDNTNFVCSGVSNRITGSGGPWKFFYDVGSWPEPPICDKTIGYSATLSWL